MQSIGIDEFCQLTLHDVVAVSDETETDSQGNDGDLPQGHISLSADSLTSRPSRVHGSPDTDSVADIVGTVSEGSGTGGDDLHEGVEIFYFVGVLFRVRVDAIHAATLRSSEDTDLSAVDVVRHAVEGSDNDLSGEANDDSLQVVTLVDGTGTKLVVVQSAHSPAQWGLLLSELGVVFFASLSKQQLVSLARVLVFLDRRGPLLGRAVDVDGGHLLGVAIEHGGLGLAGRALDIAGVLDNGVVGNLSEFGILRGGLAEEHRTLNDIPDSEVVVLLDDLAVDEGYEEQGGEEEKTKSDTKGDTGNVPGRLVGETESWRSLVDNGEGANSAGNEEEERRGPDGPAHGVLAYVHDILHKREDDRAEDARCDGRHAEASEDGSESRSLVPSPLDVASTNCSNTNTGDG